MVVGPRAAAGARCQRRAASNANRSELRWGEGWRSGGALARSLPSTFMSLLHRLTPPHPSRLFRPPLPSRSPSSYDTRTLVFLSSGTVGRIGGIKKRNTGLNFYTNTVTPCSARRQQHPLARGGGLFHTVLMSYPRRPFTCRVFSPHNDIIAAASGGVDGHQTTH